MSDEPLHINVSLDPNEAGYIESVLDAIQHQGPERKRIAANIQEKLVGATRAALLAQDVVDSVDSVQPQPSEEE